MQQARHHVAVEQPLRHRQRRLRQDVQEARDQEERHVLEVVLHDPPDPLDPFVGRELRRVGIGVERRLLEILG